MDARIEAVVSRIPHHLAEPLDVRRLAAWIDLSPSRFSHVFRDEVGVSPMRYVCQRRMERARELLEGTFMGVKEVMVQVGCNDPSHFARDFRKYHGLSPSACQRRTRPYGSSVEGTREWPTNSPRGR